MSDERQAARDAEEAMRRTLAGQMEELRFRWRELVAAVAHDLVEPLARCLSDLLRRARQRRHELRWGLRRRWHWMVGWDGSGGEEGDWHTVTWVRDPEHGVRCVWDGLWVRPSVWMRAWRKIHASRREVDS